MSVSPEENPLAAAVAAGSSAKKSKTLLLLGPTGNTGKHTLKYALDQGYGVITISRSKAKIPSAIQVCERQALILSHKLRLHDCPTITPTCMQRVQANLIVEGSLDDFPPTQPPTHSLPAPDQP